MPAIPSSIRPSVIIDTAAEPVAPGKFAPTWDSLKQYEVPEFEITLLESE